MNERGGYLGEWSRLHGGHHPTGLTARWLSFVHALSGPLVRRGVGPAAVTASGVLVGAAVPLLAHGRWALAAALAVLVSGVLDSLDGAVAVRSGRASRFGAVVDSMADRLVDTAYVVALWALGAPGWLCALGGGLAAGQEYARARAAAVGMPGVGAISVWERPTRVLLTAFILLPAGLAPDHAGTLALAGALGWVGFGLVGNAQVLTSVRRSLN